MNTYEKLFKSHIIQLH